MNWLSWTTGTKIILHVRDLHFIVLFATVTVIIVPVPLINVAQLVIKSVEINSCVHLSYFLINIVTFWWRLSAFQLVSAVEQYKSWSLLSLFIFRQKELGRDVRCLWVFTDKINCTYTMILTGNMIIFGVQGLGEHIARRNSSSVALHDAKID